MSYQRIAMTLSLNILHLIHYCRQFLYVILILKSLIFQIVVHYQSQVATKTITDESMASFFKSIAMGRPQKSIIKKLQHTPLWCGVSDVFKKKIHVECCDLTSKSEENIFRSFDIEDIVDVKFKDIMLQLTQKAPLTKEILETIAGNKKDRSTQVAYAAACLLRIRNREMSRAHKSVGIVLDNGGATNEV